MLMTFVHVCACVRQRRSLENVKNIDDCLTQFLKLG